MESMICPRVIIIGGGFAGLNAAKSLKKAQVDILLIDKANHHLFQPLLYQVATAALSPSDIALPLREILANQNNVKVLLANIIEINKEFKYVLSENGDRYDYDYLIMAPGASHSYFGHPTWESFAPGLKTLNDALAIRERIILSFERAERCGNQLLAEQFMHFVIIGGGPTGVEMAGAIAEIARRSLVRNFRSIRPEQTKVYLIEGADQVLPSYPKRLGEKAKLDLEKMGVEVLLNTLVTQITAEGVWLNDTFLQCPNIIWAAGNEASRLIRTLNIDLDPNFRAKVEKDLSVPKHPELFVIGDAACVYDKKGNSLPGIAPVAIQQGRYVAKLISKKIPFDRRMPFKYFDKGMMATIGKAKAVAVVGNFKISGYFAWLSWCFIHIAYLISFSNRLLVMIQWFFLYVTNQRRVRLITRPISDYDDPLGTSPENSPGKICK